MLENFGSGVSRSLLRHRFGSDSLAGVADTIVCKLDLRINSTLIVTSIKALVPSSYRVYFNGMPEVNLIPISAAIRQKRIAEFSLYKDFIECPIEYLNLLEAYTKLGPSAFDFSLTVHVFFLQVEKVLMRVLLSIVYRFLSCKYTEAHS